MKLLFMTITKRLFVIVNDYEDNQDQALSRIEEILDTVRTPFEEKEGAQKKMK